VPVPPHPRVEQVSIYAVPVAPAALPALAPRGGWIAAANATERRPFEARLSQAADTVADHERRVQIATSNYNQYIGRESHAALVSAKRELQGAQLDADIARRQLEQFDARDRSAEMGVRYDRYVAQHEARAAREVVLERVRQAGNLLAGSVKELKAFADGNFGSRREIQDALRAAWVAAGMHPADLRDLVR
jgi:hypothetical protein